jgi:hypothetical protein
MRALNRHVERVFRPLYSLFYGTRHDTGLEVFRNCQVTALEAQSKTRAATKVGHAVQKSGQGEIFKSFREMSPEEEVAPVLTSERVIARQTLLEMAPLQGSRMLYKDLWPLVLARHIVRRVDVNKIAADLKKEGLLVFPNWEAKKRVPHPEYVVFRSSS